MVIEAVIFDLDGTLIDLSLKILDAKREFIKRIRSMGVDLGAIDELRPVEIIITYLERFRGIPRKHSRMILDECIEPYELEAVKRARLRDGGAQVLEKLRKAGYKLGLASNNSRKCIEVTLEKLGLRHLFDTIVSRDEVVRLKPCEEVVVKAIKQLGTLPQRAVYVGDSVVDMIAGRRAGAHVVAISGGADPRDELCKGGADFIINELDEVVEVIKFIEKRTL